jgi:hypothetical protein
MMNLLKPIEPGNYVSPEEALKQIEKMPDAPEIPKAPKPKQTKNNYIENYAADPIQPILVPATEFGKKPEKNPTLEGILEEFANEIPSKSRDEKGKYELPGTFKNRIGNYFADD